MIGIVFLIIFFLGLSFLGWQIARFIFKFDRIELLLPLSLAIGYGVYIFFLNIASQFIPVRLNFYLVFIFLLIISSILFFLNRKKPSLKWGITKKEGFFIFSTVFIIMILGGLLVSRSIGADDLAYPHLPAAYSIAGGNFPIKNLNIPKYNLVTHDGPLLFYAALSKITGFSVLFALYFSVFLFSGVIFLLLFNIVKLFIKNNFASFLVALVGMLGGGFRFIYGFNGLVELYKKFILHYNIEHPFKFFGDMWSTSPLSGSLVGNMFHSWSTSVLGWMLTLVIIYLYLRYIHNKTETRSYYYDFLMIILLSILALHFEMAFLVICFGILIAPFIFYFKDKNKEDFINLVRHCLLILFITTILVLFQGGAITAILKNILQGKTSYGIGLGFSILKYPLSFDIGNGTIFPFYSFTFILNFGLIYFLVIPAIIFTVKKWFKESIFLVIISCFAFLLPLFISFNWLWQGTMNYLFRFSSLIWAILVGIFLIMIFLQLKNNNFFKKIIYLLLIIICLEGFLFLVTRPLYKKAEYRLDNNSFFATLRPLSEPESLAYKWVRKNSNIKDYFLVFADEKDIDNQASILENFRFVMFTQRLAPVYTISNNHISSTLPQEGYYTPLYKKLISNCEDKEIRLLNYKYLFVDKNWPVGLEEKCLENNNLELKFEAEEGDKFVRIYRVL